jgi:hypothetical protein
MCGGSFDSPSNAAGRVRNITPSMLVSWAKSTTLAHIGSEGVTAPESSTRIDSQSKFIVIADKR